MIFTPCFSFFAETRDRNSGHGSSSLFPNKSTYFLPKTNRKSPKFLNIFQTKFLDGGGVSFFAFSCPHQPTVENLSTIYHHYHFCWWGLESTGKTYRLFLWQNSLSVVISYTFRSSELPSATFVYNLHRFPNCWAQISSFFLASERC